ncbi:hypothetical protein GWI33_001415 [Rhynchophorus ferrugineus]|uniref:Cubilin n=2 Tax=Rhynchophorus ferrugineus TaxID=354439 RepID=A0A834MLW0_RHYFE|nr:hypothetical protein GWI33_001415 [Rhynchophorus ferrugineus]
MGFSKSFLLILSAFVFCASAEHDLHQQPKIYVENGHLYFEVFQNKQIRLLASGLLINNIDIMAALGREANATLLLKTYELFIAQHQSQLDNLSKKMSLVMGNMLPSVNSSNTNFTNFDLKITRLNRRITVLRRLVSNVQARLNKNECNSSPCKNAGTCLDMYGQYFCLCQNGWEGPTCEQDINECARFVGTDLGCQNGGTCQNFPGSYQCICVNGWIGTHCNRKPNDCSSGGTEICGHGTCIPQNNNIGYKCLCDAGWTTDGVHMACIVDVDECKNNHPPCSTNPLVMCTNVPGSFMCQHCPPGYTGNGYYCADINECEILNGGCSVAPQVECINTPGSSKCSSCPPGYEGDGRSCSYKGLCNINNGGCSLLARCVDYSGTMSVPVQCVCPSGYVGTGIGPNGCIRNGNASPCLPNPCINGKCVISNSTEGFKCVCQKKYFGIYCDQYQDPCASNPCYNGGTCINQAASFRCKCPTGYIGRLCTQELEACGGRLTAPNGTITYPVKNSTFLSSMSISCLWILKTNESKILQLDIEKFNLSDAPCKNEWFQIQEVNTMTVPLGRFCGKTPPFNGTYKSTRNQVILWLKYQGQSERRPEIQISWQAIEPVCGGLISDNSGIISSPGWPSQYPNNRNCMWNFNVPNNKRIIFHVYSLDIGTNTDCSRDSISFLTKTNWLEDSQDLIFHKICNSTIPQSFYSPSPQGYINFKSDASDPHGGFQIGYNVVDGIPACGGTYTGQDGFIQSVQFSESLPEELTCLYQIKIPFNQTITVDILELNLPRNCQRQSLTFYQGSTTESLSLGTYCGSTLPGPIVTFSDSLLIESRTRKNEENRWKLKYTIVCSKTFKEPKGSFGTMTQVTKNNKPLSTCTYLIEQPESNIILLNLEMFAADQNANACILSDALNTVEIRDGDSANSTLIGIYCGGKARIQSSTNYLWIKGPTKGFIANYTTINIGCGGILRTDRRSISYPPTDEETYRANSKCRWVIVAPPTKIIQLTWITFELEFSPDCNYDYVKVFDNTTDSGQGDLIGTYCNNKLPPVLLSQSNIVTVDFASDGSINNGGFSISYAFLRKNNLCGGNYYTAAGIIRSPGFPKEYPTNRECVWTITVPTGSQIMLNVTRFEIEYYTKCKYDYLEVRNGGTFASPIIGTYCGKSIPQFISSHTNKIYLKFRSDLSTSAPGFEIKWSATATGCGGILTGSMGSIMSPHYPEPYNKNTICIWKILVSAGSKIQVIFGDLGLEENTNCIFDFVELYDGYTLNSKVIGRYCKPYIHPIQSTGNKMLVKFKSDVTLESRGFHLQYTIICKNVLKGFSGVIESPNYPNEYLENQNCEWDIIVPNKNKINITFSHFSLEGRTNSCMYDYLEILYQSEVLDSNENTFVQYGKYCAENNPGLITINSNHAKIRFISDNLLLGKGFRLEWQLFGCGGELTQSFGTLQTPNYPKPYPANVHCNWIINVPIGRGIGLFISELDVEKDNNCNYDYIEIYDGRDETNNLLAKMCRNPNPLTLTTSSNAMFISFKSDFSYQGKGFLAHYTTIEPKCGGILPFDTGYFYSPNYPKNYNKNETCEWSITTNENNRIELKFGEIDIYKYNCNKTHIKIYDGPSDSFPILQTICGSETNINRTYTSTKNHMLVKFVNYESLTYKGFNASYRKACGAFITTSTNGIIDLTKDYAAGAEDQQNCSYTIQSSDPTKRIIFTMTRLSDNHLWCDNDDAFIEIYNGLSTSDPLQGSYCTDKLPPSIISNGPALYILVKEHVDLYATYAVFEDECGGDLIALTGNIASPGWPESYPKNMTCVWTISQGPGNTVSLQFSSFDIPDSEFCNNDYLEIRETNETGKLLGAYCGTNIPSNVTTTTGAIALIFKSSMLAEGVPSTKKGFYLEFSYTPNAQLTGSSGKIGNPLYPFTLATYDSFSWLITTKPKTRIEITFEEFYSDGEPTDCSNSGIKVYDGMDNDAVVLKEVCGYGAPPPVISTSNMVFIESDYFSDRIPTKFLLSWRELTTNLRVKNNSLTKKECHYIQQVKVNENVTISSPGYPAYIKRTSECEWIFETNQSSHLKITILDIDFTTWATRSCYYATTLKLYKKTYDTGEFQLIKEICSSITNDFVFYGTNIVKIIFKPFNFLTRRGFQASVSTVCGGYLTKPSGYIIFDKDNDRGSECQWNITVGSGRTIKIEFLSFNLGGTNTTCRNALTLRNGKFSDSPYLGQGKYCGRNIPPVLTSNSNHLYIKYVGLADIPGFKLKYEEKYFECGGQITLSSTDNFTEITTPKYPNIPDPHTQCIWVITGIRGEILRVDFEERFDLTSSPNCEKDYLELRNGGTQWSPLLNRYCTEMPETVFTTDNILYIKYFTDVDEPKNGFKLKVSLGICGGTYRGTTEFDSNNIAGKIELNKNCTWQFRAIEGYYYEIKFKKIHLKGKVHLYEKIGNNVTDLGTFTGKELPSQTLISAGNVVIMDYMPTNNRDQFTLDFSTKTEKCSKTFTEESGIITSLNYPLSKPSKTICIWKVKVPAGRRITFYAEDVDVDNVIFMLFSGLTRGIKISDTIEPHKTYETVSNTAKIVFGHMNPTNHRGIKLTYSSNKPTYCQGSLNDTTGVIETPNITVYECSWSVKRHQKETFVLAINLRTDGKSGSCSEFSSGIMIEYRVHWITICQDTKNKAHILRLPAPSVTIRARNDIKTHFNFSISYKSYPCGGFINGMLQGTIKSPNYPNSPKESVECAWDISGMMNRIKINVTSLELGDDCDKSYLIIYNGDWSDMPKIGKFCRNNKPDMIITESSKAYIEYRYVQGSDSTAKGFSLDYEPHVTSCGGILQSSYNVIETPNYEQNYPNNIECLWEVNFPAGRIIELNFASRFHIEESAGCTKDFVEVFDWTDVNWISKGKYCGREIPRLMTSSANRMKILFRSDGNNTATGFRANMSWRCGGQLIATNNVKYLSSPSNPSLYQNLYTLPNLNCTYIITPSTKNGVIIIRFLDFDLPQGTPACIYQNFTIQPVNGISYNKVYCGNKAPEDERFSRPIKIIFKTIDFYGMYRGFKIAYSMDECGGNITEPTALRLDNVPKLSYFTAYNPPLKCFWNITAPENKIPVLNIYNLTMSDSYCYKDHLKVYDGKKISTSKVITELCKTVEDYIISGTSNSMLINLDIPAQAFVKLLGDIYFTYGPDAGCGGTVNLNGTGKTRSIDGPINLSNIDCQWKILAPRDYKIKIEFLEININTTCGFPYKNYTMFCSCAFIEIRDGAGPRADLMSKLCTSDNRSTRTYITSWNTGYIRLFSAGHQNHPFSARVTAFLTPCGKTTLVSKNIPQILTSPGYPQPYASDITCIWTIVDNTDSKTIQIHFNDFDLQDENREIQHQLNSCGGDHLEISDDPKKILNMEGHGINPYKYSSSNFRREKFNTHLFCGRNETLFDFYSLDKTLVIKFTSFSFGQKGRGFNLTYSNTRCDRNIYANEGRIKNKEVVSSCYISITSDVNTTLSLYFLSLSLYPTYNCSQASLEVKENNATGPVLLTFCSYGMPSPVFSSTNKLYISFKTSTSNYNLLKRMNYDFLFIGSKDGIGCGGNLFNYMGKFTSPMYPNIYREEKICTWNVKVPVGYKVALKFAVFEITGACAKNKLVVATYQKGTETVHTFCQNETPAVLFSDLTVKVQYYSSVNNGGIGWTASFQAVKTESTAISWF